MIDIVITSVAILGGGAWLIRAKMKSEKIFSLHEKKWNNTLTSIMESNNITTLDMDFMSDIDLKKKSNVGELIDIVGIDVPKGYDLIDARFDAGYVFPTHAHKDSSEFFYILEGMVKVTKCNRSPSHCEICDGDCALRNGEDYHDDIEILNLSVGDYALMETGRFHVVEAVEDCRIIAITLPPISRR